SSSSSSSSRSAPSSTMSHSFDLAESALTDTEVDKIDVAHVEQHESCVAEWSWGQFPKTMDEQKREMDTETDKSKSLSWWWFWWQWRASAAANSTSERNDVAGGGANGKEQARAPESNSFNAVPVDEQNMLSGKKYSRCEKNDMKSLRLSSDRLKALGLHWGANDCRFSITTKYQGTTWCACNIYLCKYTDKIVISDIDGTITKSDVLGQVLPAIGGQWAHAGVAELYTRIKSNGYKLVYLSSRAIGQASTTKNYLKRVEQDHRVLPDGPVLLAPDSVLVAFRREVIERRPEEFKIAALTDLKQLFPVEAPFFAGFGNR
ncbi:hypothetical protein PMAYCL1PPCAC_04080, partial [Pristionchus mayeri]